jgi:glyoxylase-like metal-dependent hydrolase (beta-lactamase superfamily II)
MTASGEVAPGVHRLVEQLPGDRDVYLYLLAGSERSVLVDTGLDRTPAAVVAPYLERIGLARERVTDVVITHADTDHSGGISAVRELLPEAVIHGHEADRELIEDVEALIERRYRELRDRLGVDDTPEARAWTRECARDGRVDSLCAPGAQIQLEPGWTVEVLHTPGHSRGSVSLWDGRRRIAVVSDAVLGDGLPTRDGAPAFPPTYRFLGEYLGTVRQLQLLAPELLLTGHYPPMDGPAAAAFLRHSRAFAERLEHELERALAGRRGRTTRELVEAIAPRVGSWDPAAWDLLAFPLAGHLERLERQGLITATGAGEPVRWSAGR